MYQRIIVLFLLILPAFAWSQQTMTLRQCIDRTLEQNVTISQARQNLAIAEQNAKQTHWANYPTLGFQTAANINGGRTIDPFTNIFTNSYIKSNTMSLGGSWLLFNGFSNQRTHAQFKAEVEAAEADIKRVEQNISLQVTQQYLDILFAEERLNMQRQQLEATNQQVARLEKLYKAGAVAEATVLDIQAQQALEEAQIVDSENQIQMGLLNLANLMNLENPLGFNIVKPGPFMVPETLPYASADYVLDSAMLTQPGLRMAEARQRASLYSADAARGRLYPRLSLNYSLSTLFTTSAKTVKDNQVIGERAIGYTQTGDTVYTPTFRTITDGKPYTNQLSDNLNQFIGLTLNVPIINGMQSRTNYQRAVINSKLTEINYQIQKNQLRYDVYNSYTGAQGSLKQYKAYQRAVIAQREAYRSAEKRFENGAINSLELTQAKVKLMQSESNLLQAQYNYLFRIKVLELYMGKPIDL